MSYTADNKNVVPDERYYWFDRLYKRVESASWMERQIDRDTSVVYVQGSRIPMAWLREKQIDAIQDGIDYYNREIAKLDSEISVLRDSLASS